MKKILILGSVTGSALLAGCASSFHNDMNRMIASTNKDDSIIVACNPDEKTGKPEFVARAGENGTFVWEQASYYEGEKPTSTTYRLIGKATIGDKYGNFVGVDPIGIFTTHDDNGGDEKGAYSVMALAMMKGKDDSFPGSYDNSHGSGDLACASGPAFSKFADAFEHAPALTREDYSNIRDKVLAGICRKPGEDHDTYALRAMKYGFGSVSLQLNEKDPNKRGGMSDYSSLAFGAKGVLVFKNGKDMSISYDSQTLSRVYLERKKIRGNQHRVILVPDLKNPDEPMVELVCKEMQAYPTVERYAVEAAQMPKAFPKKPGTMAQVDHSLCGKDNYQKARDRTDKWTRLVMGMKLSGSAMVTGMMNDRTKPEICPIMVISVSTRAGANQIKKVLGETLDGVQVSFDVGEEHKKSSAAAF
ncbi:MAG: hypothetical protein JST04_16500 [Bdellovibrionales bacterium]|nr:hypothetical protein [Bdellovibrionales bacterium]